MIRRLAWKECREGWSIWVALALLGVGTVLLTPTFMDFLEQFEPRRQRMTVLITLVVLAVTYGAVTGSMLLAGEREAKTLSFLDTLTARRSSLWVSKALIGLTLALMQGIVLAVPFVLAAPTEGRPTNGVVFWLLPALTVETMTWGLLGSSFCRSVLASAGLGGLLYALSWIVSFTLSAFGRGSATASLISRVLVDGLALFGSYLIFCQPDRQRAGGVRRQASGVRSQESGVRKPSPQREQGIPLLTPDLRSLVWLVWRQGRSDLAVLATAALVLGLVTGPYLLGSWSIWTLLVGVVFGTNVWRPEQAEGSYRFLINQRLPAGRVWLVKTTFGALCAALVVACGTLGIMGYVVSHADEARELADLWEAVTLFGNPRAVGVSWVVYGFSVGQLVGMLCSKNFVAVMFSLPLSGGLVGVWLPSLISGGLAVWQIFVAPMVLLLAGRLAYWAWASERLVTRRSVLPLGACGVVGTLWLAGCLTWRVLEVPDVGEPFDVADFRASLPGRGKNEVDEAIVTTLANLATSRRGVATAALRPEGQHTDRTQAALEDRILRQGWASAPVAFGKYLDGVFKDKWTTTLAEAVAKPLGLVTDPRQIADSSALLHLRGATLAARLYHLRAMQLQARGEDRAALEHLLVPLALSRHLRNRATTAPFRIALLVQDQALLGLEDWAHTGVKDSRLMRRAMEALARHEAELSPVADVLKTHYLRAYQGVLDYFSELALGGIATGMAGKEAYGQLFLLAQQTPWERERAERLINVLYAEYFAGRTPVPPEGCSIWLRRGPGDWSQTQREADAGLCLVRAVRLQLTLALFEKETGRPAATLSDLVPGYLRRLPADPFTGKDFGYRLSSGERLREAGGSTTIEVAKRQGVLWSAGPDGVDDGGHVQGRDRDPARMEQGSDWIFLVPRP